MSADALSLLSSFDALPAGEQCQFAAQVIRRIASAEPPPLSGDDLAQAADELLVAMERSEEGNLLPYEEWAKKFREFTRSQPLIRNPNLDDSRESIYEGCGE